MAAEQGESKPRVVLANINRGEVRTNFVQGLLDALANGSVHSVAFGESGPYLDRGRNRVVASTRQLRESGDPRFYWDWLLFVDSDIEFTHHHVDTLLAPTLHPTYNPTRHPILSGVYHNPFDDGEGDDGDEVGPVVYEWVERRFSEMPEDDPAVWAFQRIQRGRLATFPPVDEEWNPPTDNGSPSPVCEVAAVGCGFLALHHSLLATFADTFAMPLPYFDEPVVNTVHLGEDLAFCYRARTLGYPVLVNRACTVLHHKTMKLA